MDQPLVCFSHGKESGPWGTKINHLAGVAREQSCAVMSIDYRGMDDPEQRVQKLVNTIRDKSNLILVGSSMGAYVAARASSFLEIDGLFLMAPAVNLPAYPGSDPEPHAPLVWIVHGWHDEIIPVQHVIDYAKKYQSHLTLLNSDHRLINVLSDVEDLFRVFLYQAKGTLKSSEK